MLNLQVYDGVRILGEVRHQKMVKMSVSGDCYIQELNITLENESGSFSGRKFTVNSDFTGTIRNFNITDADGFEDEVLKNSASTFTGTITTADYYKLEAVNGNLVKTKTVSHADCGVLRCEYCDADVQWVPYESNDPMLFRNSAAVFHHHIYLTEDVVYTGNASNGNFIFTNEKLCLHLNGHNVTGVNAEGESVGLRTITHTQFLNIMGEGTITAGTIKSDSGAVILSNGTASQLPVNIYEGVVLGTAEGTDAPVIAGISDVTLHGTVNGTIAQQAYTLTVGATGAVETVSLTADAKLVIAEGWNGSLTLDASAVLDANGRIPAAYVELPDNFTGLITDPDGRPMEMVDGYLVLSKKFFDKAKENYCQHCDTYVEWTALTAGNNLGNSFTKDEYYHYYVDGPDAEVVVGAAAGNGNLLRVLNSASVCLQLNGHNMVSPGNIFLSTGARLSIMGEGTVTYTATGATATGDNAAFIYADRCTVTLYSGTYNTAETALTKNYSIYYTKSNRQDLTVKGNATINGKVDCTQYVYSTTLAGNCYIEELILNDSTAAGNAAAFTVDSSFTGTVSKLTFATGGTNNVISIGKSTGAFTGTITTADGSSVVADGNGGLIIVNE